MLIHGDYEAMKKFKETCQSQIPSKIIMPENKENVTFNDNPKYEQVSISSDLLKIIETLEKTKNKTKKINVNNIVYNGKSNILGLKKIRMFGKRNNKINNKISILLKSENAFDIFMNIIKIKEKKCYNDYTYLINNNILKHSITKSEDSEMKICFEYQYIQIL